MNYQQWESGVAAEIKSDVLWRVEAYRLALLASDLAWQDVVKLAQDRRMLGLTDQLYRSVGSVSANIAEGYSRSGGKDRAHFYEYALGSAREARDWYYKARHALGEDVVAQRIHLLTQVIRLLLTMIPDQRTITLRETEAVYHTSGDSSEEDVMMPAENPLK
jgi:four helix bundle protein